MKGVTIRDIFDEFLSYLKSSGRRKTIWKREDLKSEYHDFIQWNKDMYMNFSQLLFQASRWKPPILRVRGGTEVTLLQGFDRSEINDNNVSQPANMRTKFQYGQRGGQREKTLGNRKTLVSNRYGANAMGLKTQRTFLSNIWAPRANIEATVQAPKRSLVTPITSLIKRYEDKDTLNGNLGIPQLQREPNKDEKSCSKGTSSYTEKIKDYQSRTTDESYNTKSDSDNRDKTKYRQKQRNSAAQEKSEAEYEKRKIIGGVRPQFLTGARRTETRILEQFHVPLSIEIEYQTGDLRRNATLRQKLSVENYKEKFHLLLYIEELQYRKEIESYAMKTATLQKKSSRNGLLYLEVPGLAENRPSLLIGDRVYAVRLNAEGSECGDRYEGFVHGVEQQQVGLGFNRSLQVLRNMKFSVRFTFNRRPLRLMHNALDGMSSSRLAEMMFPRNRPQRYVPPKGTLTLKKRAIESNEEQRTAVENIVLGKTPPIYIIFGPPGTGKTVTMVEAICQTHERFNYNILVCALCNDACDMLASKLRDYVDKSKMIRIYAASRSWKSVPAKIKEGRTNYKDGEMYMPDEDELNTYRIIVCTFVTAGRISLMKFPAKHFKRIFIDESGQAFEPECLVALSGILSTDGKLILAGDPKQLGPIVRSPLAIRHGFQMSLLQRLMDTCPLYQKNQETGEYNPQCVTKLVKNYRSHEAILRISNQHFYDEELLVCADELKRKKMCGWEWLKNKQFPILFHGVEGNQTRDQSSPSYYNPEEVKVVKDYVGKLMESRGTHKLYAASDIGIVTPYRKQCEKIRKAVERYPGIDVGSVEVFQGQERPVIIISTVRSSKEGLTDDAKYHLGFLCDPRRFNVALTRAQGLLIIVGNPRLLCLDKYWKSLLEYCLKNKAYLGTKFSPEQFRGAYDMEEIEDLFRKIDITSPDTKGIEDDLAAPFWRIEH